MAAIYPELSLQFPPSKIAEYAEAYTYADDAEVEAAGRRIAAGECTRKNLAIIFEWKTNGRGRSRLARNSTSEIALTLRSAAEAKDERAAVKALTSLSGVGVPVASAILAAIDPRAYTIIDFRALHALGVRLGASPSIGFYVYYIRRCREIAYACGVSLRTLDKALWHWSKNQRELIRVQAMGKYDPLERHLKSLQCDTWLAEFTEIERILGCPLPPSARQYAAWWSNDLSHRVAHAWLRAGWRTKVVDVPGQHVTFYQGHLPVEAKTRATARTEYEPNFGNAVVLVSCVKSKLPYAAPARRLYTSAWFSKVRDLVEASGARWFVLSSLYGLVEPDTEIPPYDYTLNTAGIRERRAWAANVVDKLLPQMGDHRRIVMLAGMRYREFLVEPLLLHGFAVEVPMANLARGEQLAWLGERV